jgi:hypothetical protein
MPVVLYKQFISEGKVKQAVLLRFIARNLGNFPQVFGDVAVFGEILWGRSCCGK